MRVRGPRLRISAQNEFYTGRSRLPGDVVTISGRYFLDLGATNQSDTWAEFLGKTQADVEEHLRSNFLPDSPGVRTSTRGTIIIDLEGVASDDPDLSSHPSELHTLPTDADRGDLIAAWKVRFAAARAVFPNARLAQYGVPVPVTRGQPDNATWLARIAALVQAGTAAGYSGTGGAFDALDGICPVLYARYGPDDGALFFESYDTQTDTCITGAKTILKSDGTAPVILPLINTYVANGNSAHKEKLILDLPTADPLGSTWGQWMAGFRAHGIAEAFVWNGINSIYARDGVGITARRLEEFTDAGKGW